MIRPRKVVRDKIILHYLSGVRYFSYNVLLRINRHKTLEAPTDQKEYKFFSLLSRTFTLIKLRRVDFHTTQATSCRVRKKVIKKRHSIAELVISSVATECLFFHDFFLTNATGRCLDRTELSARQFYKTHKRTRARRKIIYILFVGRASRVLSLVEKTNASKRC